MKKIGCILIAAVFAALCCLPAGAASKATAVPQATAATESEKLPVVILRGMSFDSLRVDDGSGGGVEPVKEINTGDIVATLFKAAGTALIRRSADSGVDVILDYLNDIYGRIGCDETGTPVYGSKGPAYPLSVAHYPELLAGPGYSEGKIVLSCVDWFGADYTYYFAYDWRVNPLVNADAIAAMVGQALSDTGCGKVNLVCTSEGGIQALAYMTKYGYEKINKCVFVSSTFYGSYGATDLLCGNITVLPKALYYTLMDSADNATQRFVYTVLYKTRVLDGVSKLLNAFIARFKDKVYEGFVTGVFGRTPALWAMVLPDEYGEAVDYMFGNDREGNAAFIAVADKLHEMAAGRETLLKKAQAGGVEFAAVAGYNTPYAPFIERALATGDGTLDADLMGGGAASAPFGETFPENYVPAAEGCLSPDRIIDASGCIFRDATWFVKNAPHVGCNYKTEYAEFLHWLLVREGPATVFDSPAYPRFMIAGEGQTLSPLS
ncbi:MAG TPA: hypothetical protein PL044_08490 [Clostridiales bacterium]|nr:MAG: hypothetical protein BWY37_01579 [Firmicutes bacterium ADurb.Bin262]HOU10660.1 hypothetical protein [Clostridiales bacterium]HQH64123.1 hypothetical protein [Clostridiales bacterium]HQK73790.1 hypothetical protein [Clostridiales bacterium]